MADLFSQYSIDENSYITHSELIELKGVPVLAQRWCRDGMLGESLILHTTSLRGWPLGRVLQLAASYKYMTDLQALSISCKGAYVVLSFNLKKIAEKPPSRVSLS